MGGADPGPAIKNSPAPAAARPPAAVALLPEPHTAPAAPKRPAREMSDRGSPESTVSLSPVCSCAGGRVALAAARRVSSAVSRRAWAAGYARVIWDKSGKRFVLFCGTIWLFLVIVSPAGWPRLCGGGVVSLASSFPVPPSSFRVLAAAWPLGVRAVLVRRSSRSFSGWVAVPRVPASSWGAPLAAFCGSFAGRLGVPVFVRRGSAGSLLPSVPVLPRAVRRLARPARRVPPWACSWARVPVAVAGPAPSFFVASSGRGLWPGPAWPGPAVRCAGVRAAWRVSRRAALVRRGVRLAAWSVAGRPGVPASVRWVRRSPVWLGLSSSSVGLLPSARLVFARRVARRRARLVARPVGRRPWLGGRSAWAGRLLLCGRVGLPPVAG